MNDICFFCSKPIEERKSLEHIIPNKLLGVLGIKEEKLNGSTTYQYSRIKVPAHKSCNSTFGSLYEQNILIYLDDLDSLYAKLIEESDEYPERYGPQESASFLFSTWLSKIYYGLFYNNYLKEKDITSKQVAKEIVENENFKMVQKAYQDGVGFCLPSSIFVFKSSDDNFDLRTFIHPQAIMLKIKSLIFVLCIADGFLTKAYLNKSVQIPYQLKLLEEQRRRPNFPLTTFVITEIIALRLSIPKSPSFIYSDREIINMSFTTLVSNPTEYYKLDTEQLVKTKLDILKDFNVRIN